jgi:hypothetical protein
MLVLLRALNHYIPFFVHEEAEQMERMSQIAHAFDLDFYDDALELNYKKLMHVQYSESLFSSEEQLASPTYT